MADFASLYIKVDSKGVVTADRNLDKLTGTSRKTEKATDGVTRAFSKLASTIKALAFAAVAAGLAATAYALKQSISLFTSLQKELANVSTLVDTNVVSMAKFKNEILGLPSALGSATELTRGLYQALSAGVEAAKAVEFVGKAALAAKAGLSDTFTAVDAGTTILNAFGMASTEATFIYDLMFTTVKEGKTTFAELASAVGKISPIASAAGVSVTEMHAALATLTKGGFATTEASARLATALGTIIKPSSEAQKLTEQLGLEFNATALKAKGLHGFLQEVALATGGNVDQLALMFGGMESLSVMLALTGKQSQEFTDILKRMGNVSGATKEAFDKIKVVLIELWETFKNTIGKQAIILGERLSPAIENIITKMTEWIDLNDKLIKQGTDDAVGAISLAIANLTVAVKAFSIPMKVMLTGLTVIHGLIDATAHSLAGLAAAFVEWHKFGDRSQEIRAILAQSGQGSIDALERAAQRVNLIWADIAENSKAAQAEATKGEALAKWEKDVAEAQKAVDKLFAPDTDEIEKAIKEQQKFITAYNKSTLTAQELELASLKTRVDAFRAAKVNEVQLEEWMQNEIKNIKLRAQNEVLALYEELAENDHEYEEKAIDTMAKILDAQEKAWAKTELGEAGAHELRLKRDAEYREKILGTIEDVTEAQTEAQQFVSGGLPSLAAPGASPAISPAGPREQVFVFRDQAFSSEADARRYAQQLQEISDAAQAAAESAAQIAQAAAEETTRIAQQAANEAAQKLQDIADQRVELEIQILEQTGHAATALNIRRMLELAAMDESLRPLQQRLFYLEDEAKANEAAQKASEAAQKASEAAAKATRELARAQDASLKTWENSISALVSQGRAIRSFINSLGATGVSMSLSAARGAYMADLAGAQAGDATAYNRITQSAGAYISTAGQTAGSSVEMARIVAGIKSELSALKPVVTLDENIELLKLIEKSTSTTATATENLDLLGIKAIFDLTQVLTLVDNSEGLPAHLKEMIVNQSGDYMLWLQAQLDSGVSEDLQRILIDGAGTYATTVTAIAGLIDADSQRLAIDAEGVFTATINGQFGSADAKSTTLAIDAAGAYAATVNALFGSADVNSERLALDAAGDFLATVTAAFGDADTESTLFAITAANDYTTTVNAVFGTADAGSQKLAITALGTYQTTVNAVLSADIPDDAKQLGLETTNAILATVTAALGTTDATAQALGLNTVNTLAATVTAALGVDVDPIAQALGINTANTLATSVTAALGLTDAGAVALALNTANDIAATVTAVLDADIDADAQALGLNTVNLLTTTVDAVLSSDIDVEAQALGFATTNSIATTVNAALASDIDSDAIALGLNAANVLSTTVTAALGLSDDGAVSLALENANAIAATVTAALGSGNADALTLATESANTFSTVVSAALATDADTQQLKALLEGSGATTTTVDGTMTWNPNDPLKAIWVAIRDQTTLTAENTGRYALFSASSGETPAWTVYSGSGDVLARAELARYFGVTQEEWIALIAAARPQFHDGGIASGPDSGYEATLHGTELVVSPAASYPATVKGGDNVILLEEVKALRAEIKAGAVAIAKNTGKTAKILTDFDFDGMPAERTTT